MQRQRIFLSMCRRSWPTSRKSIVAVRVITGKYKGRRFEVPRTFKVRPTTDFAKVGLFNVLNGYLDYESELMALDLFAGTGSITVELLSRGCRSVTAVEMEYAHAAFISRMMERLGEKHCNVVRADVFRFIHKCTRRFNFIFADPPYALPRLAELPTLIFSHNLLASDGLFVLEHGKENDFKTDAHFVEHRTYGAVNFSFFK